MGMHENVAQIGMDIHRSFSKVTARDAQQRIVWRQRLDHRDRDALRRRLACWPARTPVVLEGSFGWSWLADELSLAGLTPHLASSRKVAAWRDLHGWAKCDRTDADLLSLLGFEPVRASRRCLATGETPVPPWMMRYTRTRSYSSASPAAPGACATSAPARAPRRPPC